MNGNYLEDIGIIVKFDSSVLGIEIVQSRTAYSVDLTLLQRIGSEGIGLLIAPVIEYI